jgi:hypothetical protein
MAFSLTNLAETFDDVVYASLGTWLLTSFVENPAWAAALAASVVLVVRGAGMLLLALARHLAARTQKIEAELQRLKGEESGARLEIRHTPEDDED